MDVLFKRMQGLYGIKFDSVYKTDESVEAAKSEWLTLLQKVTPEQIGIALEKLKRDADEWPPNLIKFHRLCQLQPEDLGLPSPEDAYRQARQGDYTRDVVLAAFNAVGHYEWQTLPERERERRFFAQYKTAVEKFMSGDLDCERVPETRRIEPPQPPKPTPEECAAAKEEFFRMIKGSND